MPHNLSKTDYLRHLQETVGWWHDPKWGVRKGKAFRRWAVRGWRATKGFRGPANPARDYNLTNKSKRLHQSR